MPHQRKIERHHLPYYLKVFNRHTDSPLGFIGNLSNEGLMLISPYPMMLYATFAMRLKLPTQDNGVCSVDFTAICQWSREDVTPGSFDSGFHLQNPSAEINEMVRALQHYFSFKLMQTV